LDFTVTEQARLKSLVVPLLDDLKSLAMYLCGNRELAEDLVAETIMKACENVSSLRDYTRVKPWLFRILNNVFLAHCRNSKRRPTVSYEEAEEDTENFSLFQELSQPFLLWWGNPEREYINQLLDREIQEAIAELPEVFRTVVVLCDVEDMSYQEISRILEIPSGTVKSRLARGRSLLQKKLWKHGRDHKLKKRKAK
jgi:RNA polymerase sigma-70 factor, ECF subfamily